MSSAPSQVFLSKSRSLERVRRRATHSRSEARAVVRFNLVDVGYGVSQALPILVDTLQRPAADEVFLLQQPEVHLHPRAQAELGSFFVSQAGKKRRFVIETHSDYLVDRVRM